MQQICDLRTCGRPLTPAKMPRGQRLCAPCGKLITKHLNSLPQLYQACEHLLEARRDCSIKVVRGRRATGIVLDDATVAVRSDVEHLLASWCEMIVQERGVARPGSRDVRKLTLYLQAHLNWLMTHEAVGDFAEEITTLVANAEQVLNPAPDRTVDLGPCMWDGCGRMLRVTISGVSQDAEPQVSCDAGHTWLPRQLAGFPPLTGTMSSSGGSCHGWMIERGSRRAPGERVTVPTELAAMAAGVSAATIRKWASRGKLTRYGSPGRAEYDLEELRELTAN